MEIKTEKLSLATMDDFLDFFDRKAFSDNPEWSGCYCLFYQFSGPAGEWETRSGGQNRRDAIEAIGKDQLKGYLAYADGVPAGWCNANIPYNYGTFFEFRNKKSSDNENSISITCFTVDPEKRRNGIAYALLDRIITDAKDEGYNYIEAYPHKDRATDAGEYHGPLKMYLNRGFEIVKETAGYTVVRYNL